MIFTILIILLWEVLNGARAVVASLDIGDSISNLCFINNEEINTYRRTLLESHLRDAINRLICSGLYMLVGLMSFVVNLFFNKSDSELFAILFSLILFFVVGSDFAVDYINRLTRKKILNSLKENISE